MIPILYEQGESLFLTNGIGRLTEAISCSVEKVRNGVYDLEMVYPMTGKRYADLAIDKIIYARHSDSEDRQPFRIYKISRPLSGKVTVYAQHVSRDLSKVTVMPFTASGIRNTLAAIPNNTIISTPFTFWTDKTTSGAFSLSAPMSVMALLGGTEGSVLDVFGGGDYEFDKWAVKLHDRMGADNGVSIRYGKNLTDLNKSTDGESLYNAVVPFYLDSATGNLLTLPEGVLAISGAETFIGTYTDQNGNVYTTHNGTEYTAEYTPTRVIPLDLSEHWETMPTVEQLRSKAQTYLQNNGKVLPDEALKISFVALWQTEEYKDFAPLQRVNMGDTVHVYYSALGVNVAMRVVKTVYDVLAERYDSIELGTTSYNLSGAIRSISEVSAGTAARSASAQAGTAAQTMVEKQTALITGQSGGNYIIDTDEGGRPIGWLLMDTDDKTTARKVLRANLNGMGFSQNGYDGPYVSAWTIDGSFNADFIRAGAINADLITTGGMSADRITSGTIDAARLNLTEYAKFTDLSTAGSTTINGSNITTGTLNADLITTGGMSAARITSGTIDAARLNLTEYAKFTDLSTAGSTTINGGNITTGAINASLITTGTLSANRIKAGTLTDTAGKFSLNMTTGALSMQDATFSGGSVDVYGASSGGVIPGITIADGRITFTGNGAESGYIQQIPADDEIEFYKSSGYFSFNIWDGQSSILPMLKIGLDGVTVNGTDVLSIRAGEVISLHSGVGGVWVATCVSSGKNIRVGIDLPRAVTGRSVTVSDWSGLYLKRSAGGAIYYGTTNMNNLTSLPSGVTMTATVRGTYRVEIDIVGENAFVTASNGTTAITDRQTIQAMFTRLSLTFS